jgi:hypothetical protein
VADKRTPAVRDALSLPYRFNSGVLSLVQAPLSITPCQTRVVRFAANESLYAARSGVNHCTPLVGCESLYAARSGVNHCTPLARV